MKYRNTDTNKPEHRYCPTSMCMLHNTRAMSHAQQSHLYNISMLRDAVNDAHIKSICLDFINSYCMILCYRLFIYIYNLYSVYIYGLKVIVVV